MMTLALAAGTFVLGYVANDGLRWLLKYLRNRKRKKSRHESRG